MTARNKACRKVAGGTEPPAVMRWWAHWKVVTSCCTRSAVFMVTRSGEALGLHGGEVGGSGAGPARRSCWTCKVRTTAGDAELDRREPSLTGAVERTTINSGMPTGSENVVGAAAQERATHRRRRRRRVRRLTNLSAGASHGGVAEGSASNRWFNSRRRRQRRVCVRRTAEARVAESLRRARGVRGVTCATVASSWCWAASGNKDSSTALAASQARWSSLGSTPARRVTEAQRVAARGRRWLYMTERSSHWPRAARSNRRSQAARRVSLKSLGASTASKGRGWVLYHARWRRVALWNVSVAE